MRVCCGICASKPRKSSRSRWWPPPSSLKKKSWKRRKRETSRQDLSRVRIRRARTGADSLHQGSHRIATKESWWRLLLALTVFVLWAPLSLVGLPCAALLIIGPGGERGSGWSQPIAGVIGAVSLALLVLSGGSGSRLPAATSAWGALGWEATRQASITMRSIVEMAPDAFPIYEPTVRFVSLTWPGMLALQTLAGLALAWQLYRRIVARAAGASVAPAPVRFRDFYMGDGWVWGIVAWLGVLILPVSSVLQVAGTNP